MAILKSTNNLCKYFPNKILVYRVTLLYTAPNYLLKISSLAVLHYYVNFQVLLVNEAVVVLHDVRVLKFAQNVNFCHYLRLFFLVHLPII